MADILSHPLSPTQVETKLNFIVNEFTRIKVPSQSKAEPREFREMSTIQKQLILKRLIEHVSEL